VAQRTDLARPIAARDSPSPGRRLPIGCFVSRSSRPRVPRASRPRSSATPIKLALNWLRSFKRIFAARITQHALRNRLASFFATLGAVEPVAGSCPGCHSREGGNPEFRISRFVLRISGQGPANWVRFFKCPHSHQARLRYWTFPVRYSIFQSSYILCSALNNSQFIIQNSTFISWILYHRVVYLSNKTPPSAKINRGLRGLRGFLLVTTKTRRTTKEQHISIRTSRSSCPSWLRIHLNPVILSKEYFSRICLFSPVTRGKISHGSGSMRNERESVAKVH